MTRMSKVAYLTMNCENIVWKYHMGKNKRYNRISILEINGRKFKKTAVDQKIANMIIDEMFAAYWNN